MDKNVIGRPRHGSELKRAPISIKVQQEMRDFLQKEADRNNRSFTQEVEIRLEGSRINNYDRTSIATAQFFSLLDSVFWDIEKLFGHYWYESEESFAMSQAAVNATLRRFGQFSSVSRLRAILRDAKTDEERDHLLHAHNAKIAEIAERGSAFATDAIEELMPSLAQDVPRSRYSIFEPEE